MQYFADWASALQLVLCKRYLGMQKRFGYPSPIKIDIVNMLLRYPSLCDFEMLRDVKIAVAS